MCETPLTLSQAHGVVNGLVGGFSKEAILLGGRQRVFFFLILDVCMVVDLEERTKVLVMICLMVQGVKRGERRSEVE